MSETQTKKSKPKSRRRIGKGWSIPGAAEEVGAPYKTMRQAIERGQVKTIEVVGLKWVPDSEVERLKEQFAA